MRNWKRIFVFVAIAGVVAVLATSAATTNRRSLSPVVESRQSQIAEARGVELAAEIARLRERLHPTTAPQNPARNVFRFEAVPSRRVAAAAGGPAAEVPIAIAVAPAVPDMSLIGIAADSAADNVVVRTAIISAFGQLFLVKDGDAVSTRYRVSRIAEEAVELKDVNDSTIVRLVLP